MSNLIGYSIRMRSEEEPPLPTSTRQRAVITGASSGIGREFARRYAREGFDVVLVARSEPTLRALTSELADRYGIEATVYAADLSDAAAVAGLATFIGEIPRIDHLVNCAGLAPEGDLSRSNDQGLRTMIDVNITALTLLTRAAVVRMRAVRSGTIINVASGAGYQPTPYLAAYGASKSYVRMFTEAVHEENRRHGIRILAVSPGDTETPMNPGATKGKRQPEQVVDTAWRALAGSAPSVVDGRSNRAVAIASSRFIPRRAGLRIAEKMFRHKA